MSEMEQSVAPEGVTGRTGPSGEIKAKYEAKIGNRWYSVTLIRIPCLGP